MVSRSTFTNSGGGWSRRAVVLTASSHEDASTFDETSDVVVERVAASTLFFPSWRAYRAIEAAIARHQPELVLLDPAWPLGLLGPRLSRPYGVVLHGAEVTIPSRLPLVASSLRYVLRRATGCDLCRARFPNAKRDATPLRRSVPSFRFPPVPIVDLSPPEWARAQRGPSALGFSDDDFLVASWSRLVPRKGFDT